MEINRILPHFFITDICDEEVTQKYEKSFEQVIQEEQEKLIRLISAAESTENIEQFYNQYNPRMLDDLYYED